MDPDELESPRAAGRPGRARLREGEPAVHRQRLEADPAQPLPRERGAQPAHQDRVRLLAHRRLAGRLHGDLAAHAAAARPRPDLHVVRLPQRHARAPERVERARARLPLAPDLRRRRALGDQDPQRRAADLVAALEGLLLADAREVRDPRLPPARLLLLPRLPDDDRRSRARHLRDGAARLGASRSRRRRSSSSRCS